MTNRVEAGRKARQIMGSGCTDSADVHNDEWNENGSDMNVRDCEAVCVFMSIDFAELIKHHEARAISRGFEWSSN